MKTIKKKTMITVYKHAQLRRHNTHSKEIVTNTSEGHLFNAGRAFFRFWLLWVMVLVLGGTHTAQSFPISEQRTDETNVRIAHDSANDRFLTVWENGSGIVGQLLSNSGVAIGPQFNVFSSSSDGEIGYEDPSVTFKTFQNQYYVVSRLTLSTCFGFPRRCVPNMVYTVLKIFDHDGRQIGSEITLPPSFSPGRNMPARYHIIADTYGSDCCILISWEDEVTGDIDGMIVNADGTSHRPRFRIASADPRVERMVNPNAIYQRDWDYFAMSYEADRRSGTTYVGSRSISAYSGTVTGEVLVCDTGVVHRRGEHPEGRPQIAYDSTLGTYLVAWREGNSINASLMDSDGPWPIPYDEKFRVNPEILCTGWPDFGCERGPDALDTPSVLSIEGDDTFRILFHEALPSLLPGRAFLSQYRVGVDSSGHGVVSRRVVINHGDGPHRNTAAAYSSASNRIMTVWEKYVNSIPPRHDIHGVTTSP